MRGIGTRLCRVDFARLHNVGILSSMPDLQTVVAFPGKGPAEINPTEFSGWLSWTQCELSILGVEPVDVKYDWRKAFERGLAPHEAAAEAASATAS